MQSLRSVGSNNSKNHQWTISVNDAVLQIAIQVVLMLHNTQWSFMSLSTTADKTQHSMVAAPKETASVATLDGGRGPSNHCPRTWDAKHIQYTHICITWRREEEALTTTTSLDEDYWMQWVSDAHLETPTELSDPCSSRPNPATKTSKRQNM